MARSLSPIFGRLMILMIWHGQFVSRPNSDWSENFYKANIKGDSYRMVWILDMDYNDGFKNYKGGPRYSTLKT